MSKKKKILIIEDDTTLQGVLLEILTEEGFEVEGASNAREAFESIETEVPSVILTDLIMPMVDGFEVIRRLKANDQWKDIPVLVLSNQGEKSDIDRALTLGASDFMVKAESSLAQITKRVIKMLDSSK